MIDPTAFLEAEKGWADVERMLHEPPLGLPAEAAKFVVDQLRAIAEEMPNECLGAAELSPAATRRLQQELIRVYVRLWEAGVRSDSAISSTIH